MQVYEGGFDVKYEYSNDMVFEKNYETTSELNDAINGFIVNNKM